MTVEMAFGTVHKVDILKHQIAAKSTMLNSNRAGLSEFLQGIESQGSARYLIFLKNDDTANFLHEVDWII